MNEVYCRLARIAPAANRSGVAPICRSPQQFAESSGTRL
jgi:hypothetical protein